VELINDYNTVWLRIFVGWVDVRKPNLPDLMFLDYDKYRLFEKWF
jgi:hypothetical protein